MEVMWCTASGQAIQRELPEGSKSTYFVLIYLFIFLYICLFVYAFYKEALDKFKGSI